MIATVTSKGQVTLPIEARKRLGIHAGTKLNFIVKDDERLEVVKAGGSLRDLKTAVPKPKKALSLDEMEVAIAEGASKRKRSRAK